MPFARRVRVAVVLLLMITGSAAAAAAAESLNLGYFRNGAWFFDMDANGVWDGTGRDLRVRAFGRSGDVPLVGRWDGGGGKRIGFYRTGQWFLDASNNGVWDGGTACDRRVKHFGGAAGDIPVAGDWNGDGIDEIGIYHAGKWLLDANGNGTWDGAVGGDRLVKSFGTSGGLPVVGDWDGTGIVRIGIFRRGEWRLDLNGNDTWDGAAGGDRLIGAFGRTGDRPVVGDWDGTGSTRVGVYRGGTWLLDLNGNGIWDGAGKGDRQVDAFGGSTVKPLVAAPLEPRTAAIKVTPSSGAPGTILTLTGIDPAGIDPKYLTLTVGGTVVPILAPGDGTIMTVVPPFVDASFDPITPTTPLDIVVTKGCRVYAEIEEAVTAEPLADTPGTFSRALEQLRTIQSTLAQLSSLHVTGVGYQEMYQVAISGALDALVNGTGATSLGSAGKSLAAAPKLLRLLDALYAKTELVGWLTDYAGALQRTLAAAQAAAGAPDPVRGAPPGARVTAAASVSVAAAAPVDIDDLKLARGLQEFSVGKRFGDDVLDTSSKEFALVSSSLDLIGGQFLPGYQQTTGGIGAGLALSDFLYRKWYLATLPARVDSLSLSLADDTVKIGGKTSAAVVVVASNDPQEISTLDATGYVLALLGYNGKLFLPESSGRLFRDVAATVAADHLQIASTLTDVYSSAHPEAGLNPGVAEMVGLQWRSKITHRVLLDLHSSDPAILRPIPYATAEEAVVNWESPADGVEGEATISVSNGTSPLALLVPDYAGPALGDHEQSVSASNAVTVNVRKGFEWREEELVLNPAGINIAYPPPSVAMDDGGNAIAAWVEVLEVGAETCRTELKAMRYVAGAGWEPAQMVQQVERWEPPTSNCSGSVAYPWFHLGMDGGGNALLAWGEQTSTSRTVLWTSAFNGTWSVPSVIVEVTLEDWGLAPQDLKVARDGAAVLTYQTQYIPYASPGGPSDYVYRETVLYWNGSAWSQALQLTPPSGVSIYHQGPMLAVAPGGQWLAGFKYEVLGPSSETSVRFFGPGWGPVTVDSSVCETLHSVALDELGNGAAVCSRLGTSPTTIFYIPVGTRVPVDIGEAFDDRTPWYTVMTMFSGDLLVTSWYGGPLRRYSPATGWQTISLPAGVGGGMVGNQNGKALFSGEPLAVYDFTSGWDDPVQSPGAMPLFGFDKVAMDGKGRAIAIRGAGLSLWVAHFE